MQVLKLYFFVGYAVGTEFKTGSYTFRWLRRTRLILFFQMNKLHILELELISFEVVQASSFESRSSLIFFAGLLFSTAQVEYITAMIFHLLLKCIFRSTNI